MFRARRSASRFVSSSIWMQDPPGLAPRILLDVGDQHLLGLSRRSAPRAARAPCAGPASGASAPPSGPRGCARGRRVPARGARCSASLSRAASASCSARSWSRAISSRRRLQVGDCARRHRRAAASRLAADRARRAPARRASGGVVGPVPARQLSPAPALHHPYDGRASPPVPTRVRLPRDPGLRPRRGSRRRRARTRSRAGSGTRATRARARVVAEILAAATRQLRRPRRARRRAAPQRPARPAPRPIPRSTSAASIRSAPQPESSRLSAAKAWAKRSSSSSPISTSSAITSSASSSAMPALDQPRVQLGGGPLATLQGRRAPCSAPSTRRSRSTVRLRPPAGGLGRLGVLAACGGFGDLVRRGPGRAGHPRRRRAPRRSCRRSRRPCPGSRPGTASSCSSPGRGASPRRRRTSRTW